ncbi:gp16 family protein [Brucella pseudogrignonensis]|uniref:gp16 family protein n=1 Tax=Brucella pseudogrignonensis TaxID=419475 RepID=UPI003ECDC97B
MKSIALINIAKNQLGLDEDTYRGMLHRVTGKVSLRIMSEAEKLNVIEDLKQKGFDPTAKRPLKDSRKRLEGKFAPKLQALWIAGFNLGVVTNGSDEALIAFVKRQTKLDHVRFLHEPADGYAAIESLKRWLNRAAGVSWAKDPLVPDWANQPHGQIVLAQWNLLTKAGHTNGERLSETAWSICGYDGKPTLNNLKPKEWQAVMNGLGKRIRGANS